MRAAAEEVTAALRPADPDLGPSDRSELENRVGDMAGDTHGPFAEVTKKIFFEPPPRNIVYLARPDPESAPSAAARGATGSVAPQDTPKELFAISVFPNYSTRSQNSKTRFFQTRSLDVLDQEEPIRSYDFFCQVPISGTLLNVQKVRGGQKFLFFVFST